MILDIKIILINFYSKGKTLKNREESKKYCEEAGFEIANVSIARKIFQEEGEHFGEHKNFWIFGKLFTSLVLS